MVEFDVTTKARVQLRKTIKISHSVYVVVLCLYVYSVYRVTWRWTVVSLRCPTVTSSLAHRPDLELLLRIRAKPSRCSGGGNGRKSWLGCNGVGPLESSGEKGGDIFLFYNGTVIMLWFYKCAVFIRRRRKTEIKLTFQVSVHSSKIQVKSVGSTARLLATGTRGSSSRGHLTPVSVLLCLCPRRLASKPTVVSGLADSEHPFNRQCRFFQRNRSGLFTMFSAWCKTRGEILVFTPLYWRTARASWKWKKDTMQHACSAFFRSTTPLVLYFLY